MRVTLQVMSGRERGRKITLWPGQVAQFGRTDWADFSFADDPAMADVHFALQCGSSSCQLRQVGKDETFVNGEPVKEVRIHNGDQITAGRTVFGVEVEGEPVQTSMAAESGGATGAATGGGGATATATAPVATEPQPPPEPQAPKEPENGLEMAVYLELDDEAKKLAREDQSPEQLLQELTSQELFAPAIRLQAHLLTKRESVWWAHLSVEDIVGKPENGSDQQALQCAHNWVIDPTEDHRRAAEKAAEATQYQTPAGWVSVAAYWSGGSISAPGLPAVKPDGRLTGQAVTGALMMVAAHGAPPSIEQRYRALLAAARKIHLGEIKLPES